ncbi:MAG: hypothetical protein M3033_14990 [Acidobacteriota bacterium]|nr:hypothetical protein [Acidobacteriota bacterium]
MKKYIRQATKYAPSFLIFAFVVIGILTVSTFGQKSRNASPPKEDVWYLTWELTIKGQGETKNLGYGKSSASWDIDRSYSGTSELNFATLKPDVITKNMTPREIAAIMASAPMTWMHFNMNDPTDMLNRVSPIKVKIKDKLIMHINQAREGDGDAMSMDMIYWDGEGTALGDPGSTLFIDKAKSTYNINILIDLHDTDKLLKIERHFTDDEGRHVTKQDASLRLIKIPSIVNLLEDNVIHHLKNLPLTLVNTGFEWDSGDIELDEPLLENMPESYKGVKAHLFYRFKKY